MSDSVIRPLASLDEREACVALQERVWGPGFADRVPASVLMIAQETGGVASGAFVEDRLVGFVFGITGYRDGEPLHWSDMLAVAPEYRGRGLGFRLKLHQRERLLDDGVALMRWTFDPLESRNAHLNLRRLGATAAEYRRDAYGASASPLHAGIGTDRLLAEWDMPSQRVEARLAGSGSTAREPVADAPVLNPPTTVGEVPRPGPVAAPEADVIRIAVPASIQELKQRDLAGAVAWRENVRAAFELAFRRNFTAVDLEREGAVSYYVLARGFDR